MPVSPCHANATCNNTEGNYTCTCDSGFAGDGVLCDGKCLAICLMLHGNGLLKHVWALFQLMWTGEYLTVILRTRVVYRGVASLKM